MELEQISPAVKEKAGELWGNRRKFLSRSFIGTAVVFSGTASASRGLAELAANHSEDITKLPRLASQIPERLNNIPEYAAKAREEIEELSEEIAGNMRTIAGTRIYFNDTCYRDGKEIKAKGPLIKIPGITDNKESSCYLDRDESIARAEFIRKDPERLIYSEKEVLEKEQRIKTPDDELASRAIHGALLVAAGIAITRGVNSEEKLNRRELFKRAKKGAITGLIWHYVNTLTNAEHLLEF